MLLRREVITASAGNHAQGLALAGYTLNILVTIVMGVDTPAIERGPVGPISVPVGGGGLIAGVAGHVKALRPEIKIIGVEAEGSANMTEALRAGRRIKLPAQTLDQFADGTAVRQVGAKPFNIARRLVDEMLTVSIDEICAAIRDIFEDTRVISEPAGALAVAGLKKWVGPKPGSAVGQDIAVVSGANINFDRLRHISERMALGAQTELLLGITILERPEAFSLCAKPWVGKTLLSSTTAILVKETPKSWWV